MTPLRQHLQSARDDYRRAAYAGDLAQDAFELADRRRRGRIMRLIWTGSATAAAIAACIVITILLVRPPGGGTISDPPQIVRAFPEIPQMPDFPRDIPLSPPNQSLAEAPAMSDLPAMPSMPAWGLAMDITTNGVPN